MEREKANSFSVDELRGSNVKLPADLLKLRAEFWVAQIAVDFPIILSPIGGVGFSCNAFKQHRKPKIQRKTNGTVGEALKNGALIIVPEKKLAALQAKSAENAAEIIEEPVEEPIEEIIEESVEDTVEEIAVEETPVEEAVEVSAEESEAVVEPEIEKEAENYDAE